MPSRQIVRVFSVQDRRGAGRAKPWVVRWEVDGRRTSRAFKTKALATAFGRKVEGDTELARKLGAPTTQCPTFGELVSDYLGAIDLRDPNVGQRLGWWKDQFGAETRVTDIDEHKVDDGLHPPTCQRSLAMSGPAHRTQSNFPHVQDEGARHCLRP